MERSEKETKIIIDTNILISALINPESIIWLILEIKSINFLVLEFFLLELEKYSDLIQEKLVKRSCQKTFKYLLSELFKNILLIPEEFYADMLPAALEIMEEIDEKDTPFLALAMKLKTPILSNDIHFKEQKSVKCYNIDEFIKEILSNT